MKPAHHPIRRAVCALAVAMVLIAGGGCTPLRHGSDDIVRNGDDILRNGDDMIRNGKSTGPSKKLRLPSGKGHKPWPEPSCEVQDDSSTSEESCP
jgi:hypothetical protein